MSDEVKEQLELMREQVEMMRHHSNENYALLIEIRDKIGSECANIMSFLYPLAMKEASREIENAIKQEFLKGYESLNEDLAGY